MSMIHIHCIYIPVDNSTILTIYISVIRCVYTNIRGLAHDNLAHIHHWVFISQWTCRWCTVYKPFSVNKPVIQCVYTPAGKLMIHCIYTYSSISQFSCHSTLGVKRTGTWSKHNTMLPLCAVFNLVCTAWCVFMLC